MRAGRPAVAFLARYWASVKKTETCWLWTGSLNANGYGVLAGPTVDGKPGRQQRAHRVAIQLAGVRVPRGAMVLHRCDVRHCVRPDHLFVGTHADNMRDMTQKGRQSRGDSHWTRTDRARARTVAARNAKLTVRGEKHPRAKLTEDNVRSIRVRVAAGGSLSAVGREFGVTAQAVFGIVNGKAWSWLR